MKEIAAKKDLEALAEFTAFPVYVGFSFSGGGTANINFGAVNGVLQINGMNYQPLVNG